MNQYLPNRGEIGPAGASNYSSGDARRFRLRDFHERKNRSEGFYARPAEEPFGANVFSAQADATRRDWGASPGKFRAGNGGRWGWWKPALLIISGLTVVSALSALGGFYVGRERGKSSANREMVERAKTLKRLPEKGSRILSDAMAELRTGSAETALETLLSLRADFPQAASLSYLAALAALQAGQPVAAENLAKESIKAGQRLSDSLAVMSMLERQKSATMGSGSDSQAEDLLRAAITADAANPAPHLELATLLRAGGRREEARKEIKMAMALQNPVDAQAVTEATLALMTLEDLPDDKIAAPSGAPRTLTESLAAAYASLRQGNPAAAADNLRAGQAMTTPEIFVYLINDPAFRKYRTNSELAAFWR